MALLRTKNMTEESKQALDVVAASTGVMSLVAWLPPLASLLTIIWMGIRIYESKTVQDLIKRFK
jgi:hypothetical protein